MNLVFYIAMFIVFGAGLLLACGIRDRKYDEKIWRRLLKQVGAAKSVFDPAAIDRLPELAQRYFRYSIQPGASLYHAVELDLEGELGLGTREHPHYRPASARQLLAPPYGLVWKVKAGSFSGSDGVTPDKSWTRFWCSALSRWCVSAAVNTITFGIRARGC